MTVATTLVAILAAGCASRFGGGKLDAGCAGRMLGEWAVEAVADAGLTPGVLIVADPAPAFAAHTKGWELLTNPAPEQGLGSSLALAAQRAEHEGAGRLMVLLADMPLVTPDHLRNLIAGSALAATDHGAGRPGVPALFPAHMFAKLAQIRGDRGASALLAQQPDLRLVLPPADTLLDVDRAEDIGRAARLLRDREVR